MEKQKLQEKKKDAVQVDFDINQKYVRIRELREDGFIEFDFAVGDPELFAEMIMAVSDFDDFCSQHNVMFLTDDGEHHITSADGEAFNWRLNDATSKRFKTKA